LKENILTVTREKLNLTQGEFADLLGISRRQIINLENGKSQCAKLLGMFCLMLPYFEDKQVRKMNHDLRNFDIKEPAIE
jgi:DNA-binding XRE family transcriptional regulator